MKKLIIFLAFFLMFSNCEVSAQTWHTANQATVAWDQVTKLNDGVTDIPATSTVKYKLWTRDEGGTITEISEVDTTQGTVTFTVEGKFIIGVSATRYENAALVSESTVSWSDVGAVAPDPFGFLFYQSLAAPLGLRTQ